MKPREFFQWKALTNPAIFGDKIKSKQDARDFLTILILIGWVWHPDDDPAEVVNPPWDKGQNEILERRMNEVRNFIEDPCEFILDLERLVDHGN